MSGSGINMLTMDSAMTITMRVASGITFTKTEHGGADGGGSMLALGQMRIYWPGSITRCPSCKKLTWANHWSPNFWECARCEEEWWANGT
jgi:hypothetical protein